MINLPIIYRFFRIIYRFSSIGRVRNLPIIYRFSPAIYRFSRGFSMKQRPINDRRNHRVDRSGCRNRSGESSRDHQIDSPVDRPSGPPNRKVIVNRFPVIVNPAALNPSRTHQSRAPIHQFASESSTSRNQIRNRPAKLAGENIRNYPQPAWPESATAALNPSKSGDNPFFRLAAST